MVEEHGGTIWSLSLSLEQAGNVLFRRPCVEVSFNEFAVCIAFTLNLVMTPVGSSVAVVYCLKLVNVWLLSVQHIHRLCICLF